MTQSDLGQKMRAVFEVTMPREEAVLRRFHIPSHVDQAPVGWPLRFAVGAALGMLFVAAGVLLSLQSLSRERVSIEPSLERDLPGKPKTEELPLAPRPVRVPSPDVLSPSPDPPKPARGEPRKTHLEQSEPSETNLPQSTTSTSWARVTESMRQSDWNGAQEALAPLLESNNAETRDSARLVRIRLRLGQASGSSVDPELHQELEQLAKMGSTSSIRASARRLIDSLPVTVPTEQTNPTNQTTPERELPPREGD